MIVKACDNCKKRNTETPLLRVHEDKAYEKYDRENCQGIGKPKIIGLEVKSDSTQFEVRQPYRDLCPACLGRFIAEIQW